MNYMFLNDNNDFFISSADDSGYYAMLIINLDKLEETKQIKSVSSADTLRYSTESEYKYWEL